MPRISPREAGGANFTIYALIDPRDQRVRYVGATSRSVKERVCGHISDAKHKNTRPCTAWVLELLSEGFIPESLVLEKASEDDWQELERQWIARYRSLGANLTNLTDGGMGWRGHQHTDDEKRRIGLGSIGKTMSEDARRLISEANKGRRLSEEHKAKLSRAGKGRKVSERTRKLMSSVFKGKPGNAGAKNGRAKLSEEDVREIRLSLESHAALGRRYGVSDVTIHGIRSRRLWSHVS